MCYRTLVSQTYTTFGNTLLEVAGADLAGDVASVSATNSLLTGATDADGDTFSVVPVTNGTTAQGGSVTISADGSFHYTPQAGDRNVVDTFFYGVVDSAGGIATESATITISNELAWYVDDDAAPGGDGTSANPFSSLAPLDTGGTSDALDQAGDPIYVLDGTYTEGLTLEDNQTLLGQGVDLVLGTTTLITGALANRPTLGNAAGNVIDLAAGNTIRGLTVGDSAAAGTGISGGAVGTLTISDTSINNTTGGGFSVGTSGVLDVTLDSLSASGGTNGVNLVGTSGTLTVNGGSLSGSSGSTLNVDGGSVDVNVNNTSAITQANNASAINVQGGHSGTITFANTTSIGATNGNGIPAE